MSLVLVTGPAAEPVSTADMKSHLRVDVSDDDTLIDGYVAAARRYFEETTHRALITQTWRLNLQAWPLSDRIPLPRPPLQSVTSVVYKDEDGNQTTFNSSNYIVDTDAEPGQIVLAKNASWPSGSLYQINPIIVTFVAGYGDAATDIPVQLVQGIKLLVGHWYENREGSTPNLIRPLPMAVESLIWLNRAWY